LSTSSTTSSSGAAPDPPLTEDRLWDHYRICLEEYRFQVDLNWRRSQYFFVLNAALLVAATGLLASARPPAVIALVLFILGALVAGMSIRATTTQHDYYRAVRDTKGSVEKRLGLGDLALTTTPGMGGHRRRFGRVTTIQKLILWALLAADVLGLVASGCVLFDTRFDKPAVTIVARAPLVRGVHLNSSRRQAPPILLRRDGEAVETVHAAPGAVFLASLVPGTYQAHFFAGRACSQKIEVRSEEPLQRLSLRCEHRRRPAR
jgi:hypothetical protein